MCAGSTEDNMLLLRFLRDDPAPLESHPKAHHIQYFWSNIHYSISSIADIKSQFSPGLWCNTFTHRISCSSGKKECSVMLRTICTTLSYVAHRHLHPWTGTTGQITISLAWQKQLCLTLGEKWKQEQRTRPVNGSDRYLTPPVLQLLLLPKMLLRWYRQLKTFPVDQETLAAENTAWQTARNRQFLSFVTPLPLKVCVFMYTRIKQFYIHYFRSVYPIYWSLELNYRCLSTMD